MLDLAIVLAFVAYAVSSGWRARREASQGLEQYFLAGRTLPGWQAGMSMAATQFAADTPLLVAGLVATGGVFLLWRLWIYGLAFLLLAFVLARSWRRAGVITDAELTEMRYGGRAGLVVRGVKAVYYGAVINCVVLAMVLFAAVRIAEVFLPWHAWLPAGVYGPLTEAVRSTGLVLSSGAARLDPAVATTDNLLSVLAIVGFTALYSTTGGLRGVVRTDVAQLGIALVGTFAYAGAVVVEVGGIGALTERVVALYGAERATEMLAFAPPGGELLLPFLVLVSLQWVFQMNSDGTGYLAQRTIACRSEEDARFAGFLFAWLQILLRSLPWLLIAVGLLVIYPFTAAERAADGFAAERELLFAHGIDRLLPPGLRGVMLAGLLAALASTIDTHLNWGASYFSRDLYERILCREVLGRRPSTRELVLVARGSTLVILALALGVMTRLDSIQTAWFVSLLFGAGLGGVLLLRWLWERINVWSELGAMGASLVVAPVLLLTTDQEWVRLLTMAAVGTGAAVLAAVLGPPTSPAVLRGFYAQVQPPGFWSGTAQAMGADPRAAFSRFARGLRTTLLVAISLFGSLYGLGRLLLPGPGGLDLLPFLAIATAAAVVPLWWREVVSGRRAGDPVIH